MAVDNELAQLFELLPERVVSSIAPDRVDELVEVVLDLGRLPEIRYRTDAVDVPGDIVSQELLDSITSTLVFGADNRAGISGTLHRIACIRDRYKNIVGLTCRVGKAVYGTSRIIADILMSGKSILILGVPGGGKTTKLRDASAILSSEFDRRVMIVDTSNEIAGDGSVPHPAIGRARRMQVANQAKQHLVIIEACENHMPEVIVIDEIGHPDEVAAAATIAERGVQLVGTAHGTTLQNIMDNPMLNDLVGGVHSIVIGDQQALRNGTRKTVMERKHNPTFDAVVEIIDLDTVAIHHNTAASVDLLLAGGTPLPEIRKVSGDEIITTREEFIAALEMFDDPKTELDQTLQLYTMGLSRDKVLSVIGDMGLDDVQLCDSPSLADAILVVKAMEQKVKAYRKRTPTIIVESNTGSSIKRAFTGLFKLLNSKA